MKEISRYQGTPIGSYQLARLIGVGPVSRVYLTERRDASQRQLALKLFEAVPLDQLEEKDQALDEIRMLACLEHPAILPILDDGIHEHMLYLVKPYAEGGSLRQRMTAAAGELLPLKETMTLLRQVGDALQFAHTQRIVHANLKPENILFQQNGKPLLADFLLPGLVKSERAARILSTFAALYMAPEQFQGAATPLSDQYALACLAYELLTGQPPFEADDFMNLARKHATQEPVPPSLLQPRRAQHIDHVVLRALVKRPEGRYPDIQTFLAELSAPPPLIAMTALPGSILGVAQPPVEAEETQALSGGAGAGVQAAQENTLTPAADDLQDSPVGVPLTAAIVEQETIRQEPPGVLPAPLEPDIHEVTTITIPAASPDIQAGMVQQMGLVPARQALLPTRAISTSRLTRRQVWLTAALVAVALLISISGIAFVFGAASNHPQSQASTVGVKRASTPTVTTSAAQTPESTAAATTGIVLASTPTAAPTHRPTPNATSTSAKPTVTATPTTAPTATPSPTPAVATVSCTVNYQVSSRWVNGFVANVTIKNTGKSSIPGWSLVFTFPASAQILSGWNGQFSQSGEQVTITNNASDAVLSPGASATPGFQAFSFSKNASNTPGSFSLNGVACQ